MAREPTANDDGKPAVRKILRSAIVPDSYRFLVVNRTRSCRATKKEKRKKEKGEKKNRAPITPIRENKEKAEAWEKASRSAIRLCCCPPRDKPPWNKSWTRFHGGYFSRKRRIPLSSLESRLRGNIILDNVINRVDNFNSSFLLLGNLRYIYDISIRVVQYFNIFSRFVECYNLRNKLRSFQCLKWILWKILRWIKK